MDGAAPLNLALSRTAPKGLLSRIGGGIGKYSYVSLAFGEWTFAQRRTDISTSDFMLLFPWLLPKVSEALALCTQFSMNLSQYRRERNVSAAYC
jgi:hypothetical protein